MIDLEQARAELLDLHRRELNGLDALTAALARAQQFGLCATSTGGEGAPVFPLPIAIPAPLHPLDEAMRPKPKRKLPGYVPSLPRAAKPGRKATGKSSALRQAIRSYAESVAEIDVEALPLSLRRDLKKTKKALANMEAAGLLVRVRSGVYRIKGKKAAAPSAPISAPIRTSPMSLNIAPPPARAGEFKPGSYRVRGRVSPMQVAIEEVAMKMGARAKWTATEMLGWLTASHRDLVDSEGRRSDMHVRLMDMGNAGLLIREGISPHSTYRLGPKLANRDLPGPVEEDDAPTIHVPRDPDAGLE